MTHDGDIAPLRDDESCDELDAIMHKLCAFVEREDEDVVPYVYVGLRATRRWLSEDIAAIAIINGHRPCCTG